MTRERSQDYDAKKQFILDRAAALFAKQGYEGTTMVDVAQACKASKSHLYHYFQAKEDLLFAIVSEHTQALINLVTPIADSKHAVKERFRTFVEAFVKKASDSRAEHIVLMNDTKFLTAPKEKELKTMQVKLVQMVEAMLAQINPKIKAGGTRGAYAMLLFGMMIWTFTWYKKSGDLSPEQLAHSISQLFLDGYRQIG